jgi:dephospho-CoA kinase
MLRIALTGGIATGKSYVLGQFSQRGIPVLDADALVHGVMAADTEPTTAIAGRFGADVLKADGSVDRAKLGAIVFADAEARRDLEAIVHPAVYRAITTGLRGFESLGGYAMAVVDVPLLYETGHEREYDRVIVTVCDPQEQLRRLAARGLSEEEAHLRLAAQLSPQEKAARADFVVHTDGSHEETDRQVEEIISRLLSETSSSRV